jgi:hypothetical protein
VTYSLKLKKGSRSRENEERILDSILLNGLAEGCGLSKRLSVDYLDGEALEKEVRDSDLLGPLFSGAVSSVLVETDGKVIRDGPKPAVLLPGAFNPVHEGHFRLAEVASGQDRARVAFELSIINVDKPPLAAREVRHRLEQFAWKAHVWLTRAPVFTEKASLFPGCLFVVGADTAERILASRYYEAGQKGMLEALGHIRQQGCRFLVAGRIDRQGRFNTLGKLAVPREFGNLFSELPESAFRMAVSSTALRGQRQPRQAKSPGGDTSDCY